MLNDSYTDGSSVHAQLLGLLSGTFQNAFPSKLTFLAAPDSGYF